MIALWIALFGGLVLTAHVAPMLGPTAVLAAYAACFLPWAGLLRTESRRANDLVWLAAAAVAVRLIVALAEPVLSDDIFRYVWEGRVTLAGHNPFASAPDAAELVALRDAAIWPRVNHPEVSTIYPPVAQYFFALIALVGGGVTTMKLALVAVEVAAAGLIGRLLPPERRRFALVCYGLNPLVVLEVAWSGHLDVLAWLPLVLALVIVARSPRSVRWMAAAGVFLGLSIASKLLGLLLLPYLALRRGLRFEWRGRVAMLVVTTLVVGGSYVGFLDAGDKLFRGFGTYAASWRNNDGLFRAFETLSRETLQEGRKKKRIFSFPALDAAAMEHGFTKEWEGETLPNTSFASDQISQAVGKGLALVAVGLAMLYCIRVVGDPLRAGLILLLTLYFFAPTVHPWYVAWLVPFAAVRWSPSAATFSFAALAGYASWWSVAHGGPWATPWWLAALEYSAVFAVIVWEVGRRQPDSATS